MADSESTTATDSTSAIGETGAFADATESAEQAIPFDANKVGMICLIISEAVLFATLVLVFLFYLNDSRASFTARGTTPSEVLSIYLVLLSSAMLFSSSGTVHFAESALHKGNLGTFRLLWGLTILLGVGFLVCTGIEWAELIKEGWTIDSGFFGSTYFTLVGFHAFHVTLGVLLLSTFFGVYRKGQIPEKSHKAATLIGWYWHFVDVVWVIVFFVVYILLGQL